MRGFKDGGKTYRFTRGGWRATEFWACVDMLARTVEAAGLGMLGMSVMGL